MSNNALPVIENLATKITTLERRREFLDDQVQRDHGSPKSLSFARAEVSALDSGVDAMRYHAQVMRGLDTHLSVLRELAESDGGDGFRQARAKAMAILEEFGA